MEVKIKNRYDDSLTFLLNEEHKCVIVKGCKYTRIGFNGDNKISFIDPQGGPFIALGMNLIEIHENFKDLIISSIIRGDAYAYVLKYEERG